MKKLKLFFIASCLLAEAKATVRIVNNNAGSNALYTSIDAGIAASTPGDTLYVYGSNVTYAQFTITKSIVILGPGSFSPKQNAFSAKVDGFICNSNLTNIIIKGLNFISIASFATKANISQVELNGNYFTANGRANFDGASNCSFINISNNIFGTIGANRIDFYSAVGLSNVLIQNNIIFGSIRSLGAPNSLISHNVFLNTQEAFEFFGPFPFSNVMIKDNIFYNANPNTNTTNCTYNNNMSFGTITYSNMNGTGNLDNVNPEFVNVGTGAYNSSYDFHLGPASQGIGASSTGDDIGYYGGTLKATVTGETSGMPVIRTMDILNPNVPLNGNINVNVRSTINR